MPDPITKFHESKYAAMFNNPISYADPLGLDGDTTYTATSTVTPVVTASRCSDSCDSDQSQGGSSSNTAATSTKSNSESTGGLGVLLSTSDVVTASDAVLSTSVSLSFGTNSLLRNSGTILLEPQRYITGYPTQYMTELDVPKIINGVETYGFVDVTSKYSSRAIGIYLLRAASTTLTYTAIGVDGWLTFQYLKGNHIAINKFSALGKYSMRTAAAHASTKSPMGAALYFIIVGGESFIDAGMKHTKSQNLGNDPFDDVTCFVQGTQISMSDGSYKSIEDIKPLDSVMSYNIESGDFYTTVIDITYSPKHTNLYRLIFDNGFENTSTNDHPYWVIGKGWSSINPEKTFSNYGIKAGQIESGDLFYVLSTDRQLKSTRLVEVTETPGSFQTYAIAGRNCSNFFANRILVSDECLGEIDSIKSNIND